MLEADGQGRGETDTPSKRDDLDLEDMFGNESARKAAVQTGMISLGFLDMLVRNTVNLNAPKGRSSRVRIYNTAIRSLSSRSSCRFSRPRTSA